MHHYSLSHTTQTLATVSKSRATYRKRHSKQQCRPWYEIMEGEAGDSGDEWLEVAVDEEDNPLSDPVEAWPFKGPGKYSC